MLGEASEIALYRITKRGKIMADENTQNNDGLQSPVDPLAAMDLLNLSLIHI